MNWRLREHDLIRCPYSATILAAAPKKGAQMDRSTGSNSVPGNDTEGSQEMPSVGQDAGGKSTESGLQVEWYFAYLLHYFCCRYYGWHWTAIDAKEDPAVSGSTDYERVRLWAFVIVENS